MTEDVLRFATIKALTGQGVPPGILEVEWRSPGLRDAVDLVITRDPRVAIEFKYPREPRETNAPWTQHLGEILKDFYRLAYMPTNFDQRWCVQLLSPRVQRYLAGVDEKYGVHIAQHPGEITTLRPNAVQALPATATRMLTRWRDDARPIQARCVHSLKIGPELSLLVHHVMQVAKDGLPSEAH